MKITNKYDLPEVFFKYAQESIYSPKPDRLSATTLSLPAEEIVLRSRHFNLLVQDVSEMINMFIGNAVHEKLEKMSDKEKAEKKLTHKVGDFTISGVVDLLEDNTIIDYKTAKVNTIIYEDYTDWRLQGLVYAWLARKNNIIIEEVIFYAILKDWSTYGKENARRNDKPYPETPIVPVSFKIRSEDIVKTEQYINSKIEKIKKLQDWEDADILESRLEKRYQPVIKYAVYKPGQKRAYRVVDTKEDAQGLAEPGWRVEKRIEENTDYKMKCPVLQHMKNVLGGS